jgi:Mn-dependent DtxR family transcriptional regulator
MVNMTPKLKQTLIFIDEYSSRNGYPPTIRDIADNFEISRTSVFERLGRLRAKKLIISRKGMARSLKPTAAGTRYLLTYK